MIPGYENVGPTNRICSTIGATAGSNYVSGTSYISTGFKYEHSHKWRNIGILIGFLM